MLIMWHLDTLPHQDLSDRKKRNISWHHANKTVVDLRVQWVNYAFGLAPIHRPVKSGILITMKAVKHVDKLVNYVAVFCFEWQFFNLTYLVVCKLSVIIDLSRYLFLPSMFSKPNLLVDIVLYCLSNKLYEKRHTRLNKLALFNKVK